MVAFGDVRRPAGGLGVRRGGGREVAAQLVRVAADGVPAVPLAEHLAQPVGLAQPGGAAEDVARPRIPTLARGLGFFAACFVLVVAYVGYVLRNLANGGDVQTGEGLKPLAFDPTKSDPPGFATVIVQSAAAGAATSSTMRPSVERMIRSQQLAIMAPCVATDLSSKSS